MQFHYGHKKCYPAAKVGAKASRHLRCAPEHQPSTRAGLHNYRSTRNASSDHDNKTPLLPVTYQQSSQLGAFSNHLFGLPRALDDLTTRTRQPPRTSWLHASSFPLHAYATAAIIIIQSRSSSGAQTTVRLRTHTRVIPQSGCAGFRCRFSLFYGSDNNYGNRNTLDDAAVDYFLVTSEPDQVILDAPSQSYSFRWEHSSTSVLQGTSHGGNDWPPGTFRPANSNAIGQWSTCWAHTPNVLGSSPSPRSVDYVVQLDYVSTTSRLSRSATPSPISTNPSTTQVLTIGPSLKNTTRPTPLFASTRILASNVDQRATLGGDTWSHYHHNNQRT